MSPREASGSIATPTATRVSTVVIRSKLRRTCCSTRAAAAARFGPNLQSSIAAPPSAARDASSTPPARSRRGLTWRSRSLTVREEDTEAAEYRKGYNRMVDAASARSESIPQTRCLHRRRELAADCRAVHCRRHAEAAARCACRGRYLSVVLLLGADVEEVMAGDVKAVISSVVGALGANPVALWFFAA